MSKLQLVNEGRFQELFTRQLGWSLPRSLPAKFVAKTSYRATAEVADHTVVPVAEYAGLSVWVLRDMPERYERRQIATQLTRSYPDSLLIFSGSEMQVWLWPESSNKPGHDVRLTAQRHLVTDSSNNALESRIRLLDVRALGAQASGTSLLRALKNAFDADAEAASAIADLHDALVTRNGASTELEVFLTRVLFLLFGDDTDLFGRPGVLHDSILKLPLDGSGTARFFEDVSLALGSPEDARGEIGEFSALPYVNGGLFSTQIQSPTFDSVAQTALFAASRLDWSHLSPAIFGAMFQGVLEVLEAHILDPTSDFKASRDQLGAHYTSEANILKVIEPLFLEDYRNRFSRSLNDVHALKEIKSELAQLTFLDPACGCGNFLVVTYRELRHLEHDILQRLIDLKDPEIDRDSIGAQIMVDVDQFFGIEIVESASQIAKVALWITDHQMNREASDRFGSTRTTIPLRSLPQIVRADALTYSWDEVLPSIYCSFVIGNPPFLGSKRNDQKMALKAALSALSSAVVRSSGELDLVAGWFALGAKYLKRQGLAATTLDIDLDIDEVENVWWTDKKQSIPSRLQTERVTRLALVATNSISQGEQVGILWPHLFGQGMEISFAYKSFKWTNDAPGMAAVHCVILALNWKSNFSAIEKRIYSAPATYESVKNISPYLIDADESVVTSRSRPISAVPMMSFGNQPIDGGHFQVSQRELDELGDKERLLVEGFLKTYIGAREMLNGGSKRILWITEESSKDWATSPLINRHLDLVQKMRSESDRKETRELKRGEWGFKASQGDHFLAFPGVSSEARNYIPIAFYSNDVVPSNALLVVPGASLLHFAVLTSKMHNVWIRVVSGRLKSDIRYSASVTYNTFPWPQDLRDFAGDLDLSGKKILKQRETAGGTLAQLYSNLDAAPELNSAHLDNDALVDEAYGYQGADNDEARFRFLFRCYIEALTRAE